MRIHRLIAALVLLMGLLPTAVSAEQPGASSSLRTGHVQGQALLHGVGIVCGLNINSFTVTIAGARFHGVMPGDNIRLELRFSGDLQVRGGFPADAVEHGAEVTMEDLMVRFQGRELADGSYEVTGQVRGGSVGLSEDPAVSLDGISGRLRGVITTAEEHPPASCRA
jgi:hypothetical protein